MSLLLKIQNLYPYIKNLLSSNPKLRDDDSKLIARIWLNEIGGIDKANKMSALDLLKKIADKSLTNTESITRARRKVQKENENLKGISYMSRKQQNEIFKKYING